VSRDRTSRKPHTLAGLKMSMTKGEMIRHTTRIRALSFQATSRSRVRG
jgi:hypothetical protein